MLTLLAGSAAGKIVGLLSIPILTRLYSPEDYGALSIFVSVVTILGPFATLKYTSALPLPRLTALALNLVVLILFLILANTLLMCLLFLVGGRSVFMLAGAPELHKWWWLIVFCVMASALYELLNLWCTRNKNFRAIASTQWTQSLAGNCTKIALGLIGFQPLGLMIGHAIGQSAGIGTLLNTVRKDVRLYFKQVNLKRVFFAGYYYRDFALYRLPAQSLMTLSSQAPILIMAAIYSKHDTGQLGLALTVLAMPASVIGATMSQAFYAEVAKIGKRNIDQIGTLTKKIQIKLFCVGVPCALLLYICAEQVFMLFFGREWAEAGRYAAILSPYILLQLTSAPLIQVLNIIGSQKIFLAINVCRILCLGGVYVLFNNVQKESWVLVRCISIVLTFFYLFVSAYVFLLVRAKTKSNLDK